MSVKIGVSGASVMARQGRDAFLRYVDMCEELDWDSIWFSDRIVGQAWRMDPIVGMGVIVGRTEKLKFGTSVLIMSVRSPVATARALATIDMLSNGRLVVGVGVGQESPVEYEAMGVRKTERGRRLDEAITVMRRLWTEERVTYESEFLKLADVGLGGLKPSRPDVPIWIGSRAEPGLRRTGMLGDGWLPTQVTPEDVRQGIARIQEYASEAGRQIPDDHFGVQISTYVVEKGEVPSHVWDRALVRRSDVSPGELALMGTPEQITDRMREFIAAGATKFVFNPACGPEEMEEQLRLQAEAIVQPFHKKLVPLG